MITPSTIRVSMVEARSKTRPSSGAQFLRFFGPILDALRALGGSGRPDEVAAKIAQDLQISDEVQNALLPSGQSRFRNQVAFARLYLRLEGLVESSQHGVWTLTERGRKVRIDLEQAGEIFRKWVSVHTKKRKARATDSPDMRDPESRDIVETPPIDYRSEVLSLMQQLPPSGFERLCQRILREAGFQEVVVTGRSGDQGIDGEGVLQINPLVSSRVLLQCKRYKDSVSASQVRDFRGAMWGRTDKGIILTTGTFTAEAKKEASRDGAASIELIDGDRIEVGLVPTRTFKVDPGFFAPFTEK